MIELCTNVANRLRGRYEGPSISTASHHRRQRYGRLAPRANNLTKTAYVLMEDETQIEDEFIARM